MSGRALKRAVAKARMTAMGFGNVNRGMSKRSSDGVPNWRKALMDKGAEQAQMMKGLRIKQRKEAKKAVSRRKIKKVEVSA